MKNKMDKLSSYFSRNYKKILEILILVMIVIQPFLDCFFLNSNYSKYIFGVTVPTFIRFVILFFILMFYIIKTKNIKKFFMYGALLVIYLFLQRYYNQTFTSYYGNNFNYNFLAEIKYVLILVCPLLIAYVVYKIKYDEKIFSRAILILAITMSALIIIPTIFKFALCSYSDDLISGGFLDWFLNPGLYGYMTAASKGLFYTAIVSITFVLILPYIFYKMLSSNKNVLYFIVVLALNLSLLMIGTRLSSYSAIIIDVIVFIMYLFFTFIKKDFKFNKKTFGMLFLSVLLSFSLFLYSPINSRQETDKKKQEESVATAELFKIVYNDGEIINCNNYNTEEGKAYIIEYIKKNMKKIYIMNEFIEKSYSYKNDPIFWCNIINSETIIQQKNNRDIEKKMLVRVQEINNKKTDKFFGIGYSRTSNIYNLERDFIYQYYSLGIIGFLLTVFPYILLVVIAGLYMLLHFKRKFTLYNCSLLLGIGLSLFGALYSGNVFINLGITLIIGCFFGILVKNIFEKDRKNVDYKISILTPTYNDSETIIETLNSIKEQSYKNYELVIINDGSTDNTKEIVENYIKKNKLASKIKYIEQENQDQLNALLNGSKYINGDYVLVLHSDDLLSDVNTLQNVNNYFNENSCDAIIGDLEIIDGNNRNKGKQKVNKYCKRNFIKPLQLLWLGRNLYLDTAVFEKNIFLSQVKNNYLVWNGPFWLNLDSNPFTLNVKKVNFSLIKYRVFEENYINNEIGKLNVINGELRVVTSLMKYYDIPNYKLQYKIFRLFNKLHILSLYRLFYLNRETKNKNEVIDFVLEKRFGNDYHKYIYLESLHNFYQNKRERTVKLDLADSCIYYGKDMRLFNKKMVDKKLDKLYVNVFKEMSKGFNRIEVSGEDYIKANDLIRFLGINNDVEIIIRNKKIPKTIHYVWVGGKEKPSDIKRCMKTWKKHLKDYEIIEWNENNFDINSHPFVKAAYEAKKWAFVSDYIRAWAIYNYGGIYLDTDVLVLDDFDKMLNCEAFVGYENNDHPFTATFGAVKGHQLVKDMLDYYNHLDNYDFKFGDNNTISVSDLLVKKYGCELGNKEQILNNNIKVYKDNILCNPSKDSITIHIFTGTWLDSKKSIKYKIVKHFKLRLNNRTKANLYSKIFRK